MNVPRLFKQSAIRTAAMVIVKVIGLIGRIILTRIVGAEGIGLYQIAYSFFGFVLMLTGGLPTTLAIVTAKKPAQGWQFLKFVSVCAILTSGIISLVVFRHSSDIARVLGNPGLEYAIRGLAPALFAVPLLSLLRGYLQGLERISIIALSEVIEQAFRIFFLLLIVSQLLPFGVNGAVGRGMYATFIGAFASFSLLTLYIHLDKTNSPRSTHPAPYLPLMWFLKSSLMISLTRIFIPASEFIDAILVPNRLLAAGYSTSEATAMYGVIYGMAAIVVYTPTLITGALSHTVTVQIAAEWQQGNLKKFNRLTQMALKVSWLWGLASALFLFLYANELSLFIFNTENARHAIRYLAGIPLIVGFREISTSILWSQDNKKAPFFGLLSGLVCSILAQYFLVRIPGFGYIGASIAILLMEFVSSAWNFKALQKSRKKINDLLYLIMDIAFFGGIIFGVSRLSPSMGDMAISLRQFLIETFLFFIVTGVYIYFRCVRYKK